MPSESALSRAAVPPVPAEGAAVAVAPGVHWVRMPLPFALDHINLWLLEDGEGWTVVDTGFRSERTLALWEVLFDTVLAGRPVTRVLCTHFHPDHMGLAGWLVERTGAPFVASLGEWLYGRSLCLERREAAMPLCLDFYRRAGVPDDQRDPMARLATSYADAVSPVPPAVIRVRHGDTLTIGGTPWRVVVGRGHAPEHVCLHAPALGVFIAGDQVLERISPNVGIWPSEPEHDALGEFLDSLDLLRDAVPDDVLILPSHGVPFTCLHRRLAALAAHHAERLAVCRDACATPRTAWEVMPILFERTLDRYQARFAIGETLAHLNRLLAEGTLRRDRAASGPDRYVRV